MWIPRHSFYRKINQKIKYHFSCIYPLKKALHTFSCLIAKKRTRERERVKKLSFHVLQHITHWLNYSNNSNLVNSIIVMWFDIYTPRIPMCLQSTRIFPVIPICAPSIFMINPVPEDCLNVYFITWEIF